MSKTEEFAALAKAHGMTFLEGLNFVDFYRFYNRNDHFSPADCRRVWKDMPKTWKVGSTTRTLVFNLETVITLAEDRGEGLYEVLNFLDKLAILADEASIEMAEAEWGA